MKLRVYALHHQDVYPFSILERIVGVETDGIGVILPPVVCLSVSSNGSLGLKLALRFVADDPMWYLSVSSNGSLGLKHGQ